MEFEQTNNGMFEITFQGEDEVDTVSAAFIERNDRIEANGNHSSVNAFDKKIASWTGQIHVYRRHRLDHLLDTLEDFYDYTEEEVDNILDNEDPENRIAEAAKRYRLASIAVTLFDEIMEAAEIEKEPPIVF